MQGMTHYDWAACSACGVDVVMSCLPRIAPRRVTPEPWRVIYARNALCGSWMAIEAVKRIDLKFR